MVVPNYGETIRLTVAQAVVKYIAAQYSVSDGVRKRFIPAAMGIFGHGNVAGLGQVLDVAGVALLVGHLERLPGLRAAGAHLGQCLLHEGLEASLEVRPTISLGSVLAAAPNPFVEPFLTAPSPGKTQEKKR